MPRSKSNYYHFKSSSGFTIVELLVVIVVIGILAAITIVSYTGITSRANTASMQSDLSNAATKLKLYQADNSTLPVTAADAITAKLISPNPSMDYYSYNVDNTSNPPYFCYMYRKGTNTYAVDSTSQPVPGVCLTNLVTNGDFSDGTSGWGAFGGVNSLIDNTLNVTGNGGAIDIKAINTTSNVVASGKKYYTRVKIKTTSTLATILFTQVYADGSFIANVSVIGSPIANQWYTLSGIATVGSETGNFTFLVECRFPDTATANGKVMEIQNVLAIDLTATFGAGNEPTQAQMDNTIMPQVPNNWFNIVAKANL